MGELVPELIPDMREISWVPLSSFFDLYNLKARYLQSYISRVTCIACITCINCTFICTILIVVDSIIRYDCCTVKRFPCKGEVYILCIVIKDNMEELVDRHKGGGSTVDHAVPCTMFLKRYHTRKQLTTIFGEYFNILQLLVLLQQRCSRHDQGAALVVYSNTWRLN